MPHRRTSLAARRAADLQPVFIDKVRGLAAKHSADWFVNQTGPTFWAHLNMRSYTVTAYDLAICEVFHDLALVHGHEMSDVGLSSVAWIYGTVMRRYAVPAYNRSKTIWGLLHASQASVADQAQASVASKFRALSLVSRHSRSCMRVYPSPESSHGLRAWSCVAVLMVRRPRSSARRSACQHPTTQCSPAQQHGTARHGTAWHSTAPHSTARQGTA